MVPVLSLQKEREEKDKVDESLKLVFVGIVVVNGRRLLSLRRRLRRRGGRLGSRVDELMAHGTCVLQIEPLS